MRRVTGSGPDSDRAERRPPSPAPGTSPFPAGSPGALQGVIGNAAVSRLIARERNRDQAAPAPGGSGEPDAVREAARAAGRGGGRLPDGLRTSMESAFGTDLGHLRVSVNAPAAASIDARAYTVGDHIVVRNASVLRDVETMAHEIHHTTQHDAPSGLSDPHDRWEREASDVGARVARGHSAHRGAADGARHAGGGRGGAAVQRRVGFEFEAMWRVRNQSEVTEEDERDRQAEVARNNAAIDAAILKAMADRKQPNRLRAPEEKDSPDDLAARWLTPLPGGARDRFQPTAEGSARIERAKREDPGEYQEQANRAIYALRGNGLIRETPLLGREIPKGHSVGSGTDYRLTSDVSPTGGSALEWVTEPLSTKDQLLRVMGEITALSTAMDSRQGDESFLLDEVTFGSFRALPHMRVFPEGALSYEPQMTGGFKLAELPRLVKYLNAPEKAPLLFGRSAHAQRTAAKKDLHRDTLAPIDGIRRRAKEQVKELPREIGGKESSSGLVGLVTLVGSYLRYGSRLPVNPNSKSIAGGLMSRTSFAHNFSLLPEPVRDHFRADPTRFVAFALRAAGLPETGTEPLYNKPVPHSEPNHPPVRIPLTRAEWLAGIPVGKDLLRNYTHLEGAEKEQVSDRREEWQQIHPSLGASGTVSDRVGRPGSEEVALVAELRRMRERVPTEDLQPIAVAAFDLVQLLNEGKPLKYRKE